MATLKAINQTPGRSACTARNGGTSAWQFDYWQWLSLTPASPVVVYGGWPFHRAALINLRHGAATMDTLVSLGTLATSGIGRGAQLGILIRGVEALGSTRRVSTIVLDKTGTVTTGRMAVVAVHADDDVLRLAGAVEAASEHPLGRVCSTP